MMKKVMVATTAATGAAASMPARCVAVYDYEPQADDELALTKGDVLQIAEANDDGWWEGTIVSLGGDGGRESLYASGMFPFNYVQALPAEDEAAGAAGGAGAFAGATAGGATTGFEGTTPTGFGRTTSNVDTVLYGSQELGHGHGGGESEANGNAPAAGGGEPMLVVHAPPSMATSNVLYSPEAARATEAMPMSMASNNTTVAQDMSAVKAAALSGMRIYDSFAASNKPSAAEPLPVAAPVDVNALGRKVGGLGDVEAVGLEVDAIVNAEQDLSSEMLNSALQVTQRPRASSHSGFTHPGFRSGFARVSLGFHSGFCQRERHVAIFEPNTTSHVHPIRVSTLSTRPSLPDIRLQTLTLDRTPLRLLCRPLPCCSACARWARRSRGTLSSPRVSRSYPRRTGWT